MRTTLSLVLAAALVAACAKNNEPPQTAASATQPQPASAGDHVGMTGAPPPIVSPTEPTTGELLGSKAAMTEQATPGSEQGAKSFAALSDGEVLGILAAANDGEVQMAELALHKVHADEVRDFAAMMKEHHTRGLMKTKTTATKTKIAVAESDVSTHLKTEVGDIVKDLKTKTGAEFDAAYMDAQVKAHKEVLATINDRLTPSAQNGQVSALVAETKKIVEGHLSRAIDIDKKAGSGISMRRADKPSVQALR